MAPLKCHKVLKKRNFKKGFTLLEVMVACSILTVGIAALLSLFSSSLQALSLAQKYQEAQLEAENMMAEYLFQRVEPPFFEEWQCDLPLGARCMVDINIVEDRIMLNQIDVQVSFKHVGRDRSVALSTLQFN